MDPDKYELEADIIEAILRNPAGFNVEIDGVACVRRYLDPIWFVEWEEYNNPHSNPKVEYEVLEFENPRKAAECFVDLRREVGLGLDLKGIYQNYMLGSKLKLFLEKWIACGGVRSSTRKVE